MDTVINKVTYKLFIGCLLTSEIRMHLNQSKVWKQVVVLPADRTKELIEVHHNGKDYLGLYITQERATFNILNEMTVAIEERLHAYCPQYGKTSVKICIFAQVFVA